MPEHICIPKVVELIFCDYFFPPTHEYINTFKCAYKTEYLKINMHKHTCIPKAIKRVCKNKRVQKKKHV